MNRLQRDPVIVCEDCIVYREERGPLITRQGRIDEPLSRVLTLIENEHLLDRVFQ